MREFYFLKIASRASRRPHQGGIEEEAGEHQVPALREEADVVVGQEGRVRRGRKCRRRRRLGKFKFNDERADHFDDQGADRRDELGK